jgi:pyrimidine nucleoside transport protein
MCGLYLQFVIGLIVIRWTVGRSIFQCIADKFATFLSYADAGSSFVYGDMLIGIGVFAFKVCIHKTILS